MSRQKLAALILSSILKYLSLRNTDADADADPLGHDEGPILLRHTPAWVALSICRLSLSTEQGNAAVFGSGSQAFYLLNCTCYFILLVMVSPR